MCYFNSQPRKETDLPVCSRNVPIGISIHSLARRLTGSAEEDWERCYISIHSLARRLTVKAIKIAARFLFQFTASHGG